MSLAHTRQWYIDYIKRQVTGGVLRCEIPDETIGKLVDDSLDDLQRFISQTKLVTVPYARCIDLTNFDHNAIIHVYRTEGYTGDTTSGITTSDADPLYAQTWTAFTTGGSMYNLQTYLLNYAAYSTLLQVRNTLTTDLDFKEDKVNNKLYITSDYGSPAKITIEYIPIFRSVEEITSNYWVNILKSYALAKMKIALGRIRTRYSQNNIQWANDGEKLLTEGLEALNKLEERLTINDNLFEPLD